METCVPKHFLPAKESKGIKFPLFLAILEQTSLSYMDGMLVTELEAVYTDPLTFYSCSITYSTVCYFT